MKNNPIVLLVILFFSNLLMPAISYSEDTLSAGIAAGTYTRPDGFFPFLVQSNNSGATWSYPRGVLDDLKTQIDPNLVYGLLRSASCSGVSNKTICVAAGSYCKTDDCSIQLPLIALGTYNIVHWLYPQTVYAHLPSKIDPDLRRAFFTGVECSGFGHAAFCIASGVYTTSTSQMPLIALGNFGGEMWSYPTSGFQDLPNRIDPDFSGGVLNAATCNQSLTESVCIVTGSFCKGNPCQMTLPLLGLSSDNGKNWTYPADIFKNLTTVIDPNLTSAEFSNGSCTGQGNQTICVAAGRFFNNLHTFPLLAFTQNGGATWSYPSNIFKNLPGQIGHDAVGGFFKAASCTGKSTRARCIAAGAFTTSRGLNFPLSALTKDGGHTWTYPSFIFTKLKTVVDADVRQGSFNSATCTQRNKQSVCMAAGEYCADKACGKKFPLLTVTTDGGKTWNYPTSIFKNLTSVIDPEYLQGFFSDVSCTRPEPSFCIASGQFSTANSTYPLVAYSTDSGKTWIYPPYVFKDLTTSVHPNFQSGLFNGSGAAASVAHPISPFNTQ